MPAAVKAVEAATRLTNRSVDPKSIWLQSQK
jgi:hypothetical protein